MKSRAAIVLLVGVFLAIVGWIAMSGGTGGGSDEKIITTPSGLKYVEQKEGTGKEAKAGDSVQVNYTGYLKNGSKFDSSFDHHEPFTFPLGQGKVIKGWDEGIAGMKAVGKRKLIIPGDLAYGKMGMPPKIPPDAELTFEVELLKIN